MEISIRNVESKSTYWADFVKITELQYHVCVDLAVSMSFINSVYYHCRELL